MKRNRVWVWAMCNMAFVAAGCNSNDDANSVLTVDSQGTATSGHLNNDGGNAFKRSRRTVSCNADNTACRQCVNGTQGYANVGGLGIQLRFDLFAPRRIQFVVGLFNTFSLLLGL